MELTDFQKEYYDEIRSLDIKLELLEKFGVSKLALSTEVYLRDIYGDKIIAQDIEETELTGAKKTITKLGESELSIKSELEQIYENIETSGFDEKLPMLGIKFDE